MAVSKGNTPDTSKFRFHFHEPIWYFEPKMKLPKPNLLKAQCLALAESCGDAFTYHIITETDNPSAKRQVIMRSVIKTRRKHVGKPDEHVNDNPDMESFTLSLSDITNNNPHPSSGTPSLGSGEMVETLDETSNHGTLEKEPEDLEMNDPEEQLPEELNS